MKNLFKIFVAAGLAFTMTSCGTANDVYGNNYPNNYPNNGTVYRTSDGTVYRQGDVYRDRNGNVYQNGRIIRTGDIYGRPGILSRNGTYGNAKRLPPGQAKKIYGGSAKDYAYGQTKKRNGSWNNNRNWQDDDRYGKDDHGKHQKGKHKKGKKSK